MEFKTSDNLLESSVYSYYLEQKAFMKKYFTSLGHTLPMVESLTHYDEDSAGVVWLEVDGKPVGIVSYKKDFIDKRVIAINFIKAEPSYYESLYTKFEDYARSLNCACITEAVSLKDNNRINRSIQDGFKKDFYFLFKRVS